MTTAVTEARTRKQISDEFRKWNNDGSGETVSQYDFPAPEAIGSRKAICRFILRSQAIVVECESQPDYATNLRAIYYAVKSMRMNEKRGIADTMRKAYLQLEAPPQKRDPYELLGVRPDTPLEDIEAMFKIKAKRAHPDVGGSDKEMKELNEAWEQIQEEQLV